MEHCWKTTTGRLKRFIGLSFWCLMLFVVFSLPPPGSSCLLTSKSDSYHSQKLDKKNIGTTYYIQGRTEGIKMDMGGSRRLLSGPGSSPPRCNSKCGRCTPCKPVHVPVPPGTPVTTEYYPEAWRCKCGNRYYMP